MTEGAHWWSALPDWLVHIGGEPKDWLIGLVVCIAIEAIRRYVPLRFLHNKRIHRDPPDVRAESLLREKRIRPTSGVELIDGINLGARDVVERAARPDDPSAVSELETAWGHTSLAKYARMAPWFISPGCRVAAGRGHATTPRDDALGVVNGWARRPPKDLRAEIRGDAGTGKTVLLHQLFLSLVRSKSRPVPLIASADNINQNSSELERLKHASDHLSAFVSVWLKNRKVIAKSEAEKITMEGAVRTAIESGEVILLLDGIDQMRDKGAEHFVDGLLARTKRWIVTRRYEESVLPDSTGHVITLDSSWNRTRILEYARRRLVQNPELSAKVESVLLQRVPEKGTASQWLSNPDNLRAYLDEITPRDRLVSIPEMHRLAESAAGLMENLLMRDVQAIEDANLEQIREALSFLAIYKLGDPRARMDGAIGQKVAGLKTLLRNDGQSLVFRHSAEREYFLASQLGRELLAGPAIWPEAEGLKEEVNRIWGPGRTRLTSEYLRSHGETDRLETMGEWLRASSPLVRDETSKPMANAKRNVLEVLRTPFENGTRLSPPSLQHLNLNGMDGRGLDLQHEHFESCSFLEADMRDAEMMHAHFITCAFADADLRAANAVGAEFQGCSFGEADHFAKVTGLEIEGIRIVPAELELKLIHAGARSQRSRYRGKFGEHFLTAQRAFLGPAVEDLEVNSYVPAIKAAIARAQEKSPEAKIFLIDLMAGGQGGRSEQLLAQFSQLHMLSIDRDPAHRSLGPRHEWIDREFGPKTFMKSSPRDPFELRALLREGFADSDGHADVVIAKKALHELDRALQPALLESTATVLRPGGRFVLFADVPGGETQRSRSEAMETAIQRHEELRNLLLQPATGALEVKRFIGANLYPPDSTGEWWFLNDWIAIKDWANLNRHELANRYFASIGEIREWARPWFGDPVEVKTHFYDINPLRFNERGINRVLHHLERKKDDSAAAISQDLALLAEHLTGTAKFRALVDITRMVFEKSPAFAAEMQARPARVCLSEIDPLLRPLETAEVCPQFKMKCAVMSFERSR